MINNDDLRYASQDLRIADQLQLGDEDRKEWQTSSEKRWRFHIHDFASL